MIENLALLINETEKLISNSITRKFKENGIEITFEQYTILNNLWNTNSLSQCHLAMLTNRDQASTSRIINTLIKNELIVKRVCLKDKRINRIELTERGASLKEPVLKLIDECLVQTTNGLNEEQIMQGVELLNTIKENLNK